MSFWIGVGAFVLVALALLLLPWWRQRSAPAGRPWEALGVLGALPALTVGLYIYLGAPGILEEQALSQAQTRYDAEGIVRALEDKLKKNPNDAEGWYALGRAYIAFERAAEAEEALRKAATQAPKDARILAQLAEAIALGSGSLQGRPLELVTEALAINPDEEKALELAGLAAYQEEKWAEALHYWRRLLRKLPKDNDLHDAVSQAVGIAERQLAEKLGGTGMAGMPEAQERKKSPSPH
ncbi:MAG: tetratricopeptide repeat protein [Sulfuritalea sp.]|nr:tetratricopeptide repeat protein [Sulfuritalea sp.]